jgi:hypothetical protein
VLDQLSLPAAIVHAGYLLAMFALGAYLSDRNLTKRMAG